ncbi:MAG: AbrB/MazE/SpoVT family DNA-binding domain-containing protein [Acidobacteriaceae bacterium]|nr:AbrB/MazE/SpoVT family DNA-binding domain-containing protein [Acidobacteriaceae bacterium]MBV9764148.1 AbrB/MazE/SpoVT family DNA-binding domain-containing protein [Acidobacteriaceae bacterium]
MPLIRVKDKFQLTLPTDLREESGLKVGDMVDAKWEHGKIVLTPKSIVDRIPQALKEVRNEARRQGLNKLSIDEIDAEVAAVRSSRRRKKETTR